MGYVSRWLIPLLTLTGLPGGCAVPNPRFDVVVKILLPVPDSFPHLDKNRATPPASPCFQCCSFDIQIIRRLVRPKHVGPLFFELVVFCIMRPKYNAWG